MSDYSVVYIFKSLQRVPWISGPHSRAQQAVIRVYTPLTETVLLFLDTACFNLPVQQVRRPLLVPFFPNRKHEPVSHPQGEPDLGVRVRTYGKHPGWIWASRTHVISMQTSMSEKRQNHWRTPIRTRKLIRDLRTRARCMVHMHDFRPSRGSVPCGRGTASLDSCSW